MTNLTFVLISALSFFSIGATAFDLKRGVISGEDSWDVLTKTDRDAGYYPKAVVESDQDGIVYVYDGSIGKTNYKENELLAGWPLTPWPYQTTSPEIDKLYDMFHIKYPFDAYQLGYRTHKLGCFANTPLRYGDLEADGQKELALWLDNDFVVFSPDYQRVVFAVTSDNGDWISADDTESDYEEWNLQGQLQYLSETASFNETIDIYGIRDYSKIYLGDFDQDKHPDILVWHKIYYSRLKDDPTPGFVMHRQELLHFERNLDAQAASESGITGEYLPQDTSEATIQGWLSANELTWQKGYPSTSECQDHEGELIPEMHDPLLNDPDVLK